MQDPKGRIKRRILDETAFVQARFSGHRHGQAVPWQRVTVRPVAIRGQRHLQFSYWDGKQDVAKNYLLAEAVQPLDELLALPFRSIHVRTSAGDLQVEISKRGKAFVREHEAPRVGPPDMRHDRAKRAALPAEGAAPFLQALGITTRDGRVRASMQSKLRQINEFLKLAADSGALEGLTQSPLQIVDCGCGSAHLTFAVYHYLNEMLGRPSRMVGIDVNESLLADQAALARSLGWDGLTFEATRILDYRPDVAPSIVLALHACDTATDEALAQAVCWGSALILAVPCCHHHLQAQISLEAAPAAFRPVLRHGILRERLGDILTDALRAQILRILGYRSEVVEFVSPEHTAKNLMIRAVASHPPGSPETVQEYLALRDYWQVRPYLEELLQAELQEWLG
ncbi:MAG: SAM-dependent methyltransferase [Chloroflexi bacterium]|nr:SAM-dependent methyltransferase [Chloroflexota bacterium]